MLILTGSEGMAPFYATTAMILLASIPLFVVSHRKMEHAEEQSEGAVGEAAAGEEADNG